MYKADVIKFFGSVGAVAAKLGIDPAAVSQWGEVIPRLRAFELERLSNYQLKIDLTLYQKAA
jgi:DNA-binding transcriptional regulator YdaS (Cro superfamily)